MEWRLDARPRHFTLIGRLSGVSGEGYFRQDGWLEGAASARRIDAARPRWRALARLDEGVIRGWWQRWASALIGFPTGLRPRCVVVDLDPKEVPAMELLAALTTWCGQL
ncbi:bifunctional DNA primase/polymerase [Bosea sp. LC85]|uniref:bifunctional DNA primase/polymerase n=1 Tax=Bosea sp. LC85 TaxID=1502851 RepID=UPI0009DDDE5C|nr:bifunctional DNA primase/polymerase [Bosea sp. LC85]